MKRRKKLLLFSLLAASLATAWLFTGLYADREFGFHAVFLKHRPSPRFYFFAPLGESDRTLQSLPSPLRDAETAFHDFVEVHDGYHRSLRVWN